MYVATGKKNFPEIDSSSSSFVGNEGEKAFT